MNKIIKQLLFINLFFLGGCDFAVYEKSYENYDISKVPLDHDYDEIKEFELSFDSIFEPLEKSYFVYFYSLTCSHCTQIKNFIIEKAIETREIYFVKASNQIILKDDVLSTIGAGKIDDIGILGYPSLLKIENKIVIKNVAGITPIKELLNN